MTHHEVRGEQSRAASNRLNEAGNEAQSVLGSTLKGPASRVGAYFMGAAGEAADPIELWGRRIGRVLSVIAFVLLSLWLLHQLRFI